MPNNIPVRNFETSCPYLPPGGDEGDVPIRTSTNTPYTSAWQKLIAFVEDETALVPPGAAGAIVFVKNYQGTDKSAVALWNPDTATYEIIISSDI